jgi:hypothetical protein
MAGKFRSGSANSSNPENPMNPPKFHLPFLAILASTCAGSAAVLVYEDYDYALTDGTTMNGVATAATGLTGNYAAAGTSGTSVYQTTGLTFGANYLPVSGGAVRLSSPTGTTSSLLGAQISVGGAQTGTLWSSYLVNITTKSNAGNATAQARVSDVQAGAAGTQNNRMNSQGDGFVGGVLGTAVTYSGSGATTSGATTLTVGNTYLMLSQFTNAGTAGGGTATLRVFDLAGYNDWLTLGGGLEANLGTYDLSTQTHSFTTQADFGDGDFFVFAASNASGATAAQTVVYDELRWGTSLGDVVAVPETNTVASLAGGLAMLVLLRRRPVSI